MKMYGNIFFLLYSTILLCLISCAVNPETPKVSSEHFLDISVLPSEGRIPGDLDLYIKNKTDDCVVFPNDFGIEIFLKVDEDWVKVKNWVEYVDKREIRLTSFSGIEPDAIVFIRPDYGSLLGKPSDARIVLHAYLCNKGKPADSLSSDLIEIPLK